MRRFPLGLPRISNTGSVLGVGSLLQLFTVPHGTHFLKRRKPLAARDYLGSETDKASFRYITPETAE